MLKSKKTQHISQLILVIGAAIVINMIAINWFFRVDLTSEKRYTLADNTKYFLKDLEEVVYVKVYLHGDLNVGFKNLSRATNELLDEFRVYAGSNIEYSFIDPMEGSKKEQKERLSEMESLGMAPQQVFEAGEDGRNTRTLVYPFAVVYYNGKQLPINLLENVQGFSGSENLNKSLETLEYKFVDAFRRITSDEKMRIAFLEGHDELDELDVLDITDQLSQNYEVDRGVLGDDPNILSPYKAVIIAKPQERFSELDKYILDQYLMNGGRIMWLVDAVNITVDSLRKSGEAVGILSDINISDQLFKYGVRINPVIVQDIQAGMIPVSIAKPGQQPSIVPAPWLYSPLLIPQPNHSITRNLNVVTSEFVSTIDTVNNDLDLERSVLLRSSRYSKVDQVPVYITLALVNQKPDRREFTQSFLPTAIAQKGVFKSIFENRLKPNNINSDLPILTSSKPTKMIVVADGDIIKNKVRFKGTNPKVLPLGFDEMTNTTFGNKDFIVNAVNYLCDDEGWMNLRSRSYTLRMLDKSKVSEQSFYWKLFNLIAPIFFLALIASLVFYYRKINYKK
ncbi:gliding motility-associated ABC transporter substrate-binding protein GldG [Saccharicrinis aurantiacus]|uniref:gliding motility-associated ABC transporter substrate-binding protein GldG n=1 Tax=Saccharicrinis aurantiacus TaxID=1849719 RepID=UPI00095023C8|nr:gliding motility-associated ABC transporter substrate-binding protein GldG [Saccharicrinis aurantiacus]